MWLRLCPILISRYGRPSLVVWMLLLVWCSTDRLPSLMAQGVDHIHVRVDHVASPDRDEDGLVDATEAWMMTDPLNPDSDQDGLLDGDEVFRHGTDPLNPDSDNDQLPDGWEIAVNLDPRDGTGENGPHGDPDQDRFRNLSEYVADTDPLDSGSLLAIIRLDIDARGAALTWIGGVRATQFIESIDSLSPDMDSWRILQTNFPPTSVTNSFLDPAPLVPHRLYRIRVPE